MGFFRRFKKTHDYKDTSKITDDGNASESDSSLDSNAESVAKLHTSQDKPVASDTSTEQDSKATSASDGKNDTTITTDTDASSGSTPSNTIPDDKHAALSESNAGANSSSMTSSTLPSDDTNAMNSHPDSSIDSNNNNNDDNSTVSGAQPQQQQLESVISTKKHDLEDIAKRIRDVKEEYSTAVKNLMDTKRDLNQKRAELTSVQSQIDKMRVEIDKNKTISSETAKEMEQKKKELEKIQSDLKNSQESHTELLKNIDQAQHTLAVIRIEQSETEQKLNEANARLYNAHEEINKQEEFQDPNTLTSAERAFIKDKSADSQSTSPPLQQEQSKSTSPLQRPQSDSLSASTDSGMQPSYAGVVEAASVVVASLKSKLTTTQKELEATQSMLVQEREQHEATKRRLESITRGENPGQ